MSESAAATSKPTPGTVAVLRSGGPRLTTCAPRDPNGYVRCAWFDPAGRYQEHDLHHATLEHQVEPLDFDPFSGKLNRDAIFCGALVTLASGGPPMTVNHLLPSGEALCIRFSGSELLTERIPVAALCPTCISDLSSPEPEPRAEVEWEEPPPESVDPDPKTYHQYNGSYAQDEMRCSDQFIDEVLGGEPDMYWNID